MFGASTEFYSPSNLFWGSFEIPGYEAEGMAPETEDLPETDDVTLTDGLTGGTDLTDPGGAGPVDGSGDETPPLTDPTDAAPGEADAGGADPADGSTDGFLPPPKPTDGDAGDTGATDAGPDSLVPADPGDAGPVDFGIPDEGFDFDAFVDAGVVDFSILFGIQVVTEHDIFA